MTDLGGISGSREPSPAVSALTGVDPGRIVTAFNRRLDIYRDKQRRAPAFAADSYNRHEALQYVIDAIQLLALEAGLADLVPHGEL